MGRANVKTKDQHHLPKYLQSTQKKTKSVPAGGTSPGKTAPAARRKSTCSVGTQCTITATRRQRKAKYKWDVPGCVTMSSPCLGWDSLVTLTTPTRTVPGALPRDISVHRTRSLDPNPSRAAGVPRLKIIIISIFIIIFIYIL